MSLLVVWGIFKAIWKCLLTRQKAEAVEEEPTKVIVEHSQGSAGDDPCPICLEKFGPNESSFRLPDCNHRFHFDPCFTKYFASKMIVKDLVVDLSRINCPYCREKIQSPLRCIAEKHRLSVHSCINILYLCK